MRTLLLQTLLSLVLTAAATAQQGSGDLNGDGTVGAADEALLAGYYGTVSGDLAFEPAADLSLDGAVNFRDLALFGNNFGTSGWPVDSAAPALFVTLNDIPGDMNDLLVVPPDAFQITLDLDSAGGSAVDVASLSVTSDQTIGLDPPGTELAGYFTSGPTGAVWEVPLGSDLARTSHYLTVTVDDLAGNQASDVYGFAVRDFGLGGQPLQNLQTVFLDFDQDRSLGTGVDFLEDLRDYGLSSASAPAIETQMRDWVVSEIVGRSHGFFGRNFDGSPGPDAAGVVFESTAPTPPFSRLCVGGASDFGASFLGASFLDVNNFSETDDDCAIAAFFGVFPQAIDVLWGSDPEYLASFAALDPAAGGPVGENALDPIVLAPGFDPETATIAEGKRWDAIVAAVAAFSQVVATVTAHETGHLVGLVAHDEAPAGLYGGDTGANQDHNVTSGGATPSENFLMNQGGSFSFEEMSGRNATPLPVVRPLGWAYLRDRVVLDSSVTALFPAPSIASVTPNPVDFGGGSSVLITISGSEFLATPQVELVRDGDPNPKPVLSVTWVDSGTLTGFVDQLLVPLDEYDVHVENPDGQVVVLVDGLVVQ